VTESGPVSEPDPDPAPVDDAASTETAANDDAG
jgi:hypothetical protein